LLEQVNIAEIDADEVLEFVEGHHGVISAK
jgi:hypothetical protein